MTASLDFIVIGVGGAGDVIATPLAEPGALSVAVPDARLSQTHLVRCDRADHRGAIVPVDDAPVSLRPRGQVKGRQNLRVAEASATPSITSATTNAPARIIGHRVASFITEDCA